VIKNVGINGGGGNGGQKKAAIYARVSTGKQDQSLEEQKRLLEEYCDKNGIYICRIYAETASGSKDDRPQYNDLMREVEMQRNEFNVVVVWKLDRFSRSMQSLINGLDFLKKHNIEFISVSDSIETSTPQGRLMFHLFGALAEFEQNLIMERTRVGIERAKREGRVCNRPKKEIDVDRVIVLLNTGNVKMKEIAKMFGTSTVTIWKRLKEAGVEKHYDKFERRKER